MEQLEANSSSAARASKRPSVDHANVGYAGRVAPDPMAALLASLEPRCMVTHVNHFQDQLPKRWAADRASFHYVLEGDCRVEDPMVAELRLEAGDFLSLSSAGERIATARCLPCRVLSGEIKSNGFDLTPFLSPRPVIHKPKSQEHDALLAQLQMLVSDDLLSQQNGGIAVINLMLSVVVVESIRERLMTVPPESLGWLQGFQDEELGPVLSAMFQKPEYAWTVEKLAETGCMSRSTFARRFRSVLGESPMEVLTSIRMQIATDLLQSSIGLKEISRKAGYRSLSAFTNAFRKKVGITPAQFRADNSTCNSTENSLEATAGR